MRSVLVTGASRGIGEELARSYSADGWVVHATVRDPRDVAALAAMPGVQVHRLDVTDLAAIGQLAASLTIPLDVVIANAGVMGADGEAQTFGSIDYGAWERVMRVNLMGSVRTCEAFTPHLRRGTGRKLVAITSKMGSLTEAGGGFTAYRTSKTALNMALTAAAPGLAADGIAVGVLNPGWVRTDMGGRSAPTPVGESVAGLRRVIDGLVPGPRATFRNFDGADIPW